MHDDDFAGLLDGMKSAAAYERGARAGFATHVPESIDVRAIRAARQLSQDGFARTYGFSISAVRDGNKAAAGPTRRPHPAGNDRACTGDGGEGDAGDLSYRGQLIVCLAVGQAEFFHTKPRRHEDVVRCGEGSAAGWRIVFSARPEGNRGRAANGTSSCFRVRFYGFTRGLGDGECGQLPSPPGPSTGSG